MSQRISLTRIIALNWYGFRQIFDVADNVLISGAFGTGKSALLDLIQYVMLGEGWRANRAAAGNARGRDLVGYCLGDTNQKTRGGERHFLRPSGVTVAALEFTRPAERGREPRRETWGVRLEYSSPQADPKRTYFGIPVRLEYSDLTADGQMLDEERFRSWIRRELGNECLFSRQQDYLSEMATHQHLYFDRLAFQRTFPKAIAFEVEDNVEKFIRDFILEENPLDVRDVRAALIAYEDTRQRLLKQEDEAAYLTRICGHHARYESSRREAAVLRHTQLLLELLQQEELRDRHAALLKRLEDEHTAQRTELGHRLQEAENLAKFIREVSFEIGRDPDEVKLNQLAAARKTLQTEVEALHGALGTVRQRLSARQQHWSQWLRHGQSLSLEGLPGLLEFDESLFESLRAGSESDRLQAMQRLAERFRDCWDAVREQLAPLTQKIEHQKTRLTELKADLANLDRGQTPGAFPLFQAIRERLGSRAEQLGRLIEVNPDAERWWPALELCLDRHRWVVIVDGESDYQEAWAILRRTAPGRGEPESLLHPGEAGQVPSTVQVGTLLEKVTLAHPLARRYVEHLLGDIVCVETAADLELCPAARAITPDGLAKNLPLRRRLKGSGAVPLTLGRIGLERMRAEAARTQAEATAQLAIWERLRSDVNAWLDSGKRDGLGDASLPDRAGELPRLPELEAELGTLRSTIDLLSTPERTERQKRLNGFYLDKSASDGRIAVLTQEDRQFETKAQPERDRKAAAETKIEQFQIEVQADRAQLGRDFSGILDGELAARRDSLRAEFFHWQECFNQTQGRITSAEVALAEAKGERLRERRELATARDERGQLRHPEYQNEFRADDDDNQAWAQRLQMLEQVELAKSRQLAEDRRRDWERRLEDSVLKELKQRTDEAERTIKSLDRHLGQPVGKYRYRITHRRDHSGYSAAWRLLDTGFAQTDPLLASVAEQDVQQAKAQMMNAIHESADGNEQARRLLDYRNYHRYDIEMVPADHLDAPPISLGQSGRNLSGGENQAPFFISMLAAFRRVYDRGNRQSQHAQQLGLVVMDEAFSKLSGDGIEDCLALAHSFQLQLVMAFPPERLGIMVPYAQTVVVCRKHVESDPKNGYVTRIDNLPMIMTMPQAMDALS
jgi:uncharacterized protein YPO0396